MSNDKRIDELVDRIKDLGAAEMAELLRDDRGFMCSIASSLPAGAVEEADSIANLDSTDPKAFQKAQLMLTVALLSTMERIEDLLDTSEELV